MNALHDRLDDPRFRRLVEAYCSQTASDEEFLELQQRMVRDAAAREFYLRYMNLEAGLESYGDSTASARARDADQPPQSARHTRSAMRFAVLATACGTALAVLSIWLWPGERAGERYRPIVCALEQISGSVMVARSDGNVRPARNGTGVGAGDTVLNQGSQSAATLVYADGTRLSLVGRASVTFNGEDQKIVTMHGGTVFASVTAQPAGNPMRVVTLTDVVEVLGTQFALDARTEETDLSVKRGLVRLTRLADGESVEVPAGRRVVSKPRSELALEEIPPVPDEWAVDFEEGLPPEWASGRLVAAGLPAGSHGGVQSVHVPSKNGSPFEIATSNRWTYGLFAVHDDSHLHLTFKMQNPGWFNILILTRAADGHPPRFAGNYIFDEPDWQPQQAGRWITATIPLSAFRPLPPARDSFENAVPFQVLFSSPQTDRGLVIDRISVTRGGPGYVVKERLSE